MVLRISSAAAIAGCNAINSLINAGSGDSAKLCVYAGSRPANVDTPITDQTLLVEFDLPDPAFEDAVDTEAGGHATANPIDPVQALNTGTASFFRVFDKSGNGVFDGDVTDTSGNGDLKLSSTSIIQGIDVTVISFTTTMPKVEGV